MVRVDKIAHYDTSSSADHTQFEGEKKKKNENHKKITNVFV